MVKDIALELKNAYLALKNAIAGIKSSDAELALFADALKAAKDKYAEGITSLLDVNDAELKYAIVLFNQKQAAYDYIVAKNNFERASGGS